MSYADYEKWKTTPIEGQPHLSIVIPAYNEEVRIVPSIGAIASHVSSLGFPWGSLSPTTARKIRLFNWWKSLGLPTSAS